MDESIENYRKEFVRWVELSVKFSAFEIFFAPVIQGLGRLSIQLDEVDKRILKRIHTKERETMESSLELTDGFTQSYLWVLGAYEGVRTLHQLAKKGEINGNVKHELVEEIKKVKHAFEEIRIPLAKMEVPYKSKNNPDISPIAYPVLDTKRGIAWNLGHNKFISRKELAEILLNLSEHF